MTIAVKLLLTVALIFSIAVPFGAFAAGEKTKGRYKTALAANTVMFFGTMLFAVCVLFGGTAFAAESTAAAGGISTVEDMEKFLALGADRLGTSRAVKILNGEQAKGY